MICLYISKCFKYKKYNSNKRILEIFGDNFNNTLIKIKKGDVLLREKFISTYIPFILKSTSKAAGIYIDVKNSDEFSIGMEAFNEAIDAYDFTKNLSFFVFAEIVIRRRMINYMKKINKFIKEYPFTDLNNNEMNIVKDNLLYCPFSDIEYIDHEDIDEEIIDFIKKLSDFKIKILDLSKELPKHMDSLRLCVNIAKVLAGDDELYDKLLKNKNIPRNKLLSKVNVHRRTIENNRKTIIALCLILRSSLNYSKIYLKYLEK